MKKIDNDPKHKRTLQEELRGILDKFDKDVSAERPAGRFTQGSAKQSVYNVNLWKKDRDYDKEQETPFKDSTYPLATRRSGWVGQLPAIA